MRRLLAATLIAVACTGVALADDDDAKGGKKAKTHRQGRLRVNRECKRSQGVGLLAAPLLAVAAYRHPASLDGSCTKRLDHVVRHVLRQILKYLCSILDPYRISLAKGISIKNIPITITGTDSTKAQ